MATVNEKKAACSYTPKVIPSTCGNCAHFVSTKEERAGVFGGTYIDESEKRCARHGFAVKKMGVCNDWQKAEGGAA
jgi:hypothetical protein